MSEPDPKSNVVMFDERAAVSHSREPNAEIVSLLELALAEAKSGRMRALAICATCLFPDGEARDFREHAADTNGHAKELIAMMAVESAKIVRVLIDNEG